VRVCPPDVVSSAFPGRGEEEINKHEAVPGQCAPGLWPAPRTYHGPHLAQRHALIGSVDSIPPTAARSSFELHCSGQNTVCLWGLSQVPVAGVKDGLHMPHPLARVWRTRIILSYIQVAFLHLFFQFGIHPRLPSVARSQQNNLKAT
jgi:hypothetical protein